MYLLVIFYPQSVTDSYFQADIYKKHCRAKRKKTNSITRKREEKDSVVGS